MPETEGCFTVAAFYHFATLGALPEKRDALLALCREKAVRGTVLLADEGVNGTIAGDSESIASVIDHLRGFEGCAALEWKVSPAPVLPFSRMKVRLKREIVTMGREGVDPAARVGRYVPPREWNDFVRRDDVVMIDTRNDYEVGIGSFEGAVDPRTTSFREFPDWWARNREAFAGKKVAMFCTGGIRCEKATSWLVGEGVADVVHLKGGILKYLEEVPAAESLWRGECFVFDQRVAVGHGLSQGTHAMCHACRRPVASGTENLPGYERGVSCPACIDEFSEEDRARFRERQRQIALAAARGERHMAGDA